jgi:cysteine-rich repeat protein
MPSECNITPGMTGSYRYLPQIDALVTEPNAMTWCEHSGMSGWPLTLAIACLTFSACFNPAFSDHPACGADGACPTNTHCLHGVCVATGCDDAVDGEPCSNTNVENGVCYQHGCVPFGCGDGISEAGEVCDDGNLISGDGCSGNCQSNELCGNGYLDSLTGEQCDNGIAGLSGDGCSSRCTVEVLDWRNVTPPAITQRYGMALGFDARRGRMVLFGGATSLSSDSNIAETWEYDGTNWFIRSPPTNPPGGVQGQMVFDAHRNRLVMFSNDTWEYDGLNWALHTTPHPAPSCDGSTYDPIREAIICFDGTNAWSYDGSDWSTIATMGPAPAVRGPMMFFALQSCSILLTAQPWALCGSNWAPINSTNSFAVSWPDLAYDSARDRAIRFNGIDTWEFDGVNWQSLPPSGGVNTQVRKQFAMAFDPIRKRTVLFGGYSPITGKPFGETWELDSSRWTLQTRATESSPGDDRIVFDRARGRTIQVTGTETWEFEGNSWHRHATAHSPPDGPMVFDEMRGVVVLFAGDLWEFDGTDWTRHATAHIPTSASEGLRMSYDSTRHRIVALDGGSLGSSETWEYDGIDWTQAKSFPLPLRAESMTFDSTRGRVVVFGGSVPHGMADRDDLNNTYEFDGMTWHGVMPVGPIPSRRERATMTYDPHRRRVVMFGGLRLTTIPINTTEILKDAWEFDGTSWSPLLTAAIPPPSPSGMSFDATRSRIVMRTGDLTWELSYGSLATPADRCIAGLDTDGDGMIACGDATHPADPDCAGYCTPSCPSWVAPSACDASAPRCGDHVCNTALEVGVCPEDCP